MTPLLTKIERHLNATRVSPARFGREAARDPRFVFDLRRGRQPGEAMTARVLTFIAANNGTAAYAVSGAAVRAPGGAR